MLQVKFWGVRGSVPVPGPTTVKTGGNTSCVEVRCGKKLVILDAQPVLGPVTTTINLPPTGDPLGHGETSALARQIAFHQPRQLRARADQAHLAYKHVDQLGQFVQASAAQDTA